MATSFASCSRESASVGRGDDEGLFEGGDALADLVGDAHGLDDGGAAGVTGVVTSVAAAAAVEDDALEEIGGDAEIAEHAGRVVDRFLAVGTDFAHEPLGTGDDDRARDEE